jgi:subtilase family serine protease
MAVSAGVTYWFMASSYRGDGGTLMFHLVYTATTHRLTLATAGTGTGTVSATPTGTSCGSNCWDYVGTPVVTLTATPTLGSEFLGWSGDADCADGSVTMNTNHACVATFSRPRLRLATGGTGSGAVGVSPAGASCGAGCWEYAYNTVVTLLQSAAPGSIFLGWTGHADCADGVVTMSSSRSCVGNFGPEPVTPPNLVVVTLKGPATAPSGGHYTVKDTTANSGTGSAGPSATKFYLSTNPTLDAGDPLLGGRAVPPLPPATSSGVVKTVLAIPVVAPGKYFLLAKADADAVVNESDEGDNLRSKVVYVGPDLLVSALTAPASARAGQVVSFSVTTKNVGKNPTVPTVTRLVYSDNAKPDAGDTELGSHAVPGLAPNGTNVWTFTATIPATAPLGTRYFIAVADSTAAQPESRETNNLKKKKFTVTP